MHIPVLTKEVLEYLDPKPGEKFIDCTLGGGGHFSDILMKISRTGKLLAIDLDARAIENQKLKIKNQKIGTRNIILVEGNFADLKNIVKENKFGKVDGILIDLGWSSTQFEESGRGFSFLKDESLDMRFSDRNGFTAADIISGFSEKDLADILWEYGEERFSRRIAKKIIERRKKKKILTTFELVDVIKEVVPARFRHRKIHFATKTFQALRIAVNRELDNLKEVLPQAVDVLAPGGRLVVISFHSLEDRIVKNFFREKKKEGIAKILTKKPIIASEEELKINKRARSAKLRAIVKAQNVKRKT